MNNIESREYRRLRAAGWDAAQALRDARVAYAWDCNEWRDERDPDDDERNYATGMVRLCVEFDPYADLSYLEDRAVYTERQAEAEYERANRDGCTGIVGEFWNGDEWVHVDSVWGFIGDDWRDSGYAADVKRATLDAATEYVNAQLLQGAV